MTHAATSTRGERFTWLMCIALVGFMCLTTVALSPAPQRPGMADELVKQTPPKSPSTANAIPLGIEGGRPLPEGAGQPASDGTAHALDPVLQIARDALVRFRAEVDDYSGIIIKRERISGSLGGEARMEFKIRTRKLEGDKLVRPLQVYLKYLDPWLSRGREVIWIENANSGKLIAHEGGLKNVLRVSLAPSDKLAMMGNKYPITEMGLEKLIEKLIEKGEKDKQLGPCQVTIADGFEVAGRPCQRIEVSHPTPDPRFDFHIAQIFIDRQRMLPLRYAAYMWPEKPGAPPPLEEEYTYTDVKLNVGLVDRDFDPENPAYNFP